MNPRSNPKSRTCQATPISNRCSAGFFGILAAIAIATTISPACAAADESLPGPIRIIVAFPPGGGSDLIARILANNLTERSRATVLVENRPGASGLIGTEAAAKAPADGKTLTLPDASHVINAFVYRNPRYEPIRDFAPVTLIGTAPVVLVVSPKSPYLSVKDIVAGLKSDPGRISMGSGGIGTLPYMAAVLFEQRTGGKLNIVSYKGGAPALQDVAGGHIDAMIPIVTAAVALIDAKRLRALAISGPKRIAALPDVPTFDEAGVADFRVENWYGVLAPAGTPDPIISRLNREIVAAVQVPSVRIQLEKLQLEPATSTVGEFAAFLEAEAVRWSQVVKAAGIRPE
jgi:tripartite-type tricarboxylate transporter receptor subunit TctC